ncbi:WD domain-containing protein [Cladophialophora immunda]|nr:WD domain-containing protein [Cladophialophora immunda]
MDEDMVDTGLRGRHRSVRRRTELGQRQRSKDNSGHARTMDSDSLLGQFSFAPATQTTVVTTTTTTTTNFPPFIIRPVRRTKDLDLKQYPLAASPTPAGLKKIHFEIGGKHTIFREAEDTTLALEQFQEEQRTLRNGNGAVQTVEKFPSNTGSTTGSKSTSLRRRVQRRPASPESITDSEDQGQSREPSFTSGGAGPSTRYRPEPVASNSYYQTSNPITPDSIPKSSNGSRMLNMRDMREPREQASSSRSMSTLLPSPNMGQLPPFSNIQPSSPRPRQCHSLESEDGTAASSDRSHLERRTHRDISQETAVPTPPIIEDAEQSSTRPQSRRALSSVPARLHVAESPSVQDGSLPSPSLSPVTAAATLQSAGYFADVDSSSEIASQHDGISRALVPDRQSPNSLPPRLDSHQLSRFANGSVTEIPAMLDYFEAIPDELKSYVMHQLLRRCPKSTLQVVADAVNPALKCDFLSLLPPELSLNILKYLDVKSLCRAAQVSRKWRQMVNSDERAWKELFDADGFTLPEGELQQAIAEGWGWQDPSGPYGYEENLAGSASTKYDTTAEAYSLAEESHNRFSGILRSKRKASTMLSNRNKQVKRVKSESREASVDVTSLELWNDMSSADGPYNAAHSAMMAVPQPDIGLSSLTGLHLYKSLYRRHHLIRRNWMFEDAKPQHIAFRAHDSHVVTCLQFDTDKIVTGSDDNNINVYGTKTGILRAILSGHEGGVWALQYEGNTLVSGSTDRSVRVWNIEEARETQVFRGHTSTVRCLQIVSPVQVGETAEGRPIMMPKQPLIITGSRDSTLRVWKLPRPEDPIFIQAENEVDADDCPYFLRTLSGHQHSVRAIAAHADTLVSGSYDCTVRVWKISTGETIHRLQGHTQKVYSVVLDHERNRCISGSMDNMVRIWDLNTGSLKYCLEGHTSLVGLLDLNCDKLVSAAADSTLRIWDPETGQCKATLSAHTGAITCFKHDGQKVISGSDRTLKLWNIKTGECVKDLLSDLSGVWQVKFNERRCVAAVQRDGLTFIEVLDYGAARDGIPDYNLGRRIVVDADGMEANHDDNAYLDLDGTVDA